MIIVAAVLIAVSALSTIVIYWAISCSGSVSRSEQTTKCKG